MAVGHSPQRYPKTEEYRVSGVDRSAGSVQNRARQGEQGRHEQQHRHGSSDRPDGQAAGARPRSARRAVLHLIRKRAVLLGPSAEAMAEVAVTARECLNCGNVGTSDICDICQDPVRANGELCVVEDVADLWAWNAHRSSRAATTRRHTTRLTRWGPKTCESRLVDRVGEEEISEVILALNATIDGQTTAHYIADQLGSQVRLTSLAQGVPSGGELDYLDDGTITAALRARKEI